MTTPVLSNDLEDEAFTLPDHLPAAGGDGMWGMVEIAEAAGVSFAAVRKWRDSYLNDQRAGRTHPRPGSLPPEDAIINADLHNWGFMRWRPVTIIRWLRQTGRMDAQLRPLVLNSRGGARAGGGPVATRRGTDGRWATKQQPKRAKKGGN